MSLRSFAPWVLADYPPLNETLELSRANEKNNLIAAKKKFSSFLPFFFCNRLLSASMRISAVILILTLASCLASAVLSPAGIVHASTMKPQPPIYPPRWSITANFKFTNASNGNLTAQGVLYQIVDSVAQLFRADDIYFAGTPFVTTYDAIFISNSSDVYARLTNGQMVCVDYPQKPLWMSQHWIADWCTYNSTVYHGATQAYRWNCVADLVTWSLDTSVPEGLLIYQFTLPQPMFDVYQELWFNNFQMLDSIDPSIFEPPAGWNCPTTRK